MSRQLLRLHMDSTRKKTKKLPYLISVAVHSISRCLRLGMMSLKSNQLTEIVTLADVTLTQKSCTGLQIHLQRKTALICERIRLHCNASMKALKRPKLSSQQQCRLISTFPSLHRVQTAPNTS